MNGDEAKAIVTDKMAGSVTATGIPKVYSALPEFHHSRSCTSSVNSVVFRNPRNRSFTIRASNNPQTEEEEISTSNETNAAFISQEDLSFLWKLGAGSFAGAAAIKYGSIIFPEITRPNILLALSLISTPVIVAVLLLIKQSSLKRQS